METKNMLLIPGTINDLEVLFRKVVKEEIAKVLPEALDNQTLLDRAELAVRLNVSKRTVANWVTKGKIPSLKVGTVDRFRYSEVIAALGNKRRKAY